MPDIVDDSKNCETNSILFFSKNDGNTPDTLTEAFFPHIIHSVYDSVFKDSVE